MPSPVSPIIILDSGLGGLTVLQAIRRLLPEEELVYFGDTARLPYGSKTAATITNFVRQIICHLESHDPKHVIIACNTASALALPELRQQFPQLSISGVVEPGARAAVEAAGDCSRPVIGVIGTEATTRSCAYERAIQRLRRDARVISRATPLLVPIIEEGRSPDDPLVRLALGQYLLPLLDEEIGVLVAGCTHYPIYKDLIARIVGPRVAVIDSAEKCAQDVAGRLRAMDLERGGRANVGAIRFFVTDDSPRFASLASRFLGMNINPPTWVSLDELCAPAADVVGLRPAV